MSASLAVISALVGRLREIGGVTPLWEGCADAMVRMISRVSQTVRVEAEDSLWPAAFHTWRESLTTSGVDQAESR